MAVITCVTLTVEDGYLETCMLIIGINANVARGHSYENLS